MSGFVAILNLDRSPCDVSLLRELTGRLALRGPDGLGWVARDSVGLGSALLRTSAQSAHETQPFTFDECAWIAGAVRLDDRAHLILQLRAAGRRALAGEPDVNLVLHAWHAWGADCVTRLQGDFSFVVWDAGRAELFAARDHFGVRPLYYAHNERVLCLSNTMGTLRRHPLLPDTLDESFIADFLLFGWSDTPTATAFRAIRRLDAAHRLSFRNDALTVQRYWQVPTYREPLRFRDPREYVRQFRDVMRQAVADRLHPKVTGFELSGGIDSTCVAATARDLQQRGATTTELHAFTFDSAGLFPADDELRYAALAATRLGLRQRTFNMREYVLFRERGGALVRPGVEPANVMLAAAWMDSVREVARAGRVMLTGHGGDGILASSQLHVLRMLRRGRWLRAARECGGYWLRRHKVPPMGIRSRLKQRLGLVPPAPAFPAWIEPELARRLGLHDKWVAQHQPPAVAGADLRAEAARHMRTSWATILDVYDAEWSRSAVEYRHPFFDLRVVDYLLQVPPLPWLASKELARDAWSNLLPEVVRNRPKVPLRGDHLRARVERGDEAPVEWCCPEIGHFICSKSAPAFHSCVDAPVSLYLVAHTVSLGLWLRGYHKKDDHE